MRIKHYTPEEIHAGRDRIVEVRVLEYMSSYTVEKPVIIKMTAKQMKTTRGTFNFASFGQLGGYATAHFLEEDVEAAIKEYVESSIKEIQENLARRAKSAKERVDMLNRLKLEEVTGP